MPLFKSSSGRPLTEAEVKAIRKVIEKHLREVEAVVEPSNVISHMAEERLAVMQKTGVPLEKFLEASVPDTLKAAIKRFGIAPNLARAIEYGQANTGLYLQGFTSDLQTRVTRTINNALRSGLPQTDLARTLWRQFGDFNRDWRMIAVTEVHSNATNGYLMGLAPGSFVVGVSHVDACAWCLNHIHGKTMKVVEPPRAGQARDWDNEIWVGKSNFGRYASEREQGTGRIREESELWKPTIPVHPACCLPETMVFGPGTVGAYMADYDGDAYELEIAGGVRLSVTANHLLLTPHGFAAAYLLRKGDDVLGCANGKGFSAFDNPNNDGEPSRIDEIIKALSESCGMSSAVVPSSPEQFHGDGRNIHGQVNIVRADGLLGSDGKPLGYEHIEQFGLGGGRLRHALKGRGHLTTMLKALARTFDGSMGLARESAPFFSRRPCHSDVHALAPVARHDASGQETWPNSDTADAELLGQRLLGHTAVVERDESFSRDVQEDARRLGVVTRSVVGVRRFHYRGPVYDLETASTLYLAEGIVSSNCRCIWRKFDPRYQEVVNGKVTVKGTDQ